MLSLTLSLSKLPKDTLPLCLFLYLLFLQLVVWLLYSYSFFFLMFSTLVRPVVGFLTVTFDTSIYTVDQNGLSVVFLAFSRYPRSLDVVGDLRLFLFYRTGPQVCTSVRLYYIFYKNISNVRRPVYSLRSIDESRFRGTLI